MTQKADQEGRDVVIIDLMSVLMFGLVTCFRRCLAIGRKCGVRGRVENVGEERHHRFRSRGLSFGFRMHWCPVWRCTCGLCGVGDSIVMLCSVESLRGCFNLPYDDGWWYASSTANRPTFIYDSNLSQLTRSKVPIVGYHGGVSVSNCSVALRMRSFRKWYLINHNQELRNGIS